MDAARNHASALRERRQRRECRSPIGGHGKQIVEFAAFMEVARLHEFERVMSGISVADVAKATIIVRQQMCCNFG